MSKTHVRARSCVGASVVAATLIATVYAMAQHRGAGTPVDSEGVTANIAVPDSVADRDMPAYFDPSIRLPDWLPHLAAPIEHASIPTNPALLPGAARAYRAGVHEGVDLPCAPHTPVRAALAGWVLGIDDERNLSVAQRDEILRTARLLGRTPPEVLAALHGRRVTLCHGVIGGRWLTTSYSHLGAIRPGLVRGARVARGEQIGWTGASGTSHAYTDEGWGELHFEVRIDGLPLGVGLSPREAGALYAAALRGDTR